MKEGSLRMKKVNELIRQQLSEIIEREVSWKQGVFVTVAKVKTTSDLRQTHVSISAFPLDERKYILRTLEKEAYALQGILNKCLHMRPLPRIKFELDVTEEHAQVVEDILRSPEF